MSEKLPKKIAEFSKDKENVKRQITCIRPVRELYPEAGKRLISEGLASRNIKGFVDTTKQMIFDQEGMLGVIETQDEALQLASAIAMYNYSINNLLVSDLAAGLYTMATTNAGLYDAMISYDSEGNPLSLYITTSRETIWKALFGPLVNDNGYGLPGTNDILRDAKKRIMPLLTGTENTPYAFASVYKEGKNGRETIKAVIKGRPLSIKYGLMTARRDKRGLPIIDNSKVDALTIELDLFFYPAKVGGNGGPITANDKFMHQVAGLTSFLQFGSRYVDEYLKTNTDIAGYLTPERRPDIMTMRKIFLAENTAFQLGRLYPGIVKESSSGRMNVVLRRAAVKDIYPSAYRIRNDRDYYDFKLFSDAVAHTGRALNTAINMTGIRDQLRANGRIYVPTTDKGAEFPEYADKVVLLKMDEV